MTLRAARALLLRVLHLYPYLCQSVTQTLISQHFQALAQHIDCPVRHVQLRQLVPPGVIPPQLLPHPLQVLRPKTPPVFDEDMRQALEEGAREVGPIIVGAQGRAYHGHAAYHERFPQAEAVQPLAGGTQHELVVQHVVQELLLRDAVHHVPGRHVREALFSVDGQSVGGVGGMGGSTRLLGEAGSPPPGTTTSTIF